MPDTNARPQMTASRLRDLTAVALREHRDVTEVALTRSAYVDRLGLNVMDTGGTVWRVHFLREPVGGDAA